MTREEAIDILKCDISADKQGIEYCHNEVGIEALEMAIKALSTIEKIKQITAIDDMVIEQDVLKYKMICDLVKGESE